MDLQLDVVSVPAKKAGAERAHKGVMKVCLAHAEISHMPEMDAEITFDADDCTKAPGTYVLGVIDGRAGIVMIRRDDVTGVLMAYANGASWPASTVEAIGRVIDARWRP